MHPTNNDGFGKPFQRFQPQQLGSQNLLHPNCRGIFGVFGMFPNSNLGRFWIEVTEKLALKKMDQPSWELELSVLPFWDPQLSYHPNQVPIIHELGGRFIPYTLGINNISHISLLMEGGKNQTSSPKLPEILVHVILPRGKTRITFISTNGWSRRFHRRSARYAFLRSGSAFTCSGRVIPGKYFTFSWQREFQRCQMGT